jgi:uncharacterized membrane protein YgcG
MNKFITPRTFMATAFVATTMASMIFIGGAKAGTAGNLHQCDSNDPSYTVQCCETLIRNPDGDFLRNSGKGCKAMTVCTGGYGKYKCTIKVPKPRKPPTYCQLHPKLCNPPPPKPTNCNLKPNPCRIKPSQPNNNQGGSNVGGGAPSGGGTPGGGGAVP